MNRDLQPADLSSEKNGLPSNSPANIVDAASWETLSDASDIFFKSLQLGRVRGVVSIVDFPTSGSKDDSKHIQLTRELINRDILVAIFSGAAADKNTAHSIGAKCFQNTGDGLAEFCDFIGIQPVLHIDGAADNADIIEFYNDLAQRVAVETLDLPVAAIAAGQNRKQAESLGALFTLEDDPAKTADLIDKHIHDKRTAVQWCDRCGGCFSPFS